MIRPNFSSSHILSLSWSLLLSETKVEPKFSLNQRLADFVSQSRANCHRAVHVVFLKLTAPFLHFFVLKILCAVYLNFVLIKKFSLCSKKYFLWLFWRFSPFAGIGLPCHSMKNKLMQTIQYRESRTWEMKEDEHTISLAKNQVCAIFQCEIFRANVIPKFIKLCMETPWWCLFQGHQDSGRKPTETSVFEFFY